MRRSKSTVALFETPEEESTKESIEESLTFKFPYAITIDSYGPELSTPVCEFIQPIVTVNDPYKLQQPIDSAVVFLTRLPSSQERLILKNKALEEVASDYASKHRKTLDLTSERGLRIRSRVDDKIDENLKLARTALLKQMSEDKSHLQSLRFSAALLQDQSVVQPTLYRQQDGYPNKMYIAGASLCGKSYFASMVARGYLTHFPNRRIVVFTVVKKDPVYQGLKRWAHQSLRKSAQEEAMKTTLAPYYPRVFKSSVPADDDEGSGDDGDTASTTVEPPFKKRRRASKGGDDDDSIEWTSTSKVLFFPIDETLLSDPPPLSLFENTLCIFDDVESNVEQRVRAGILELRDSLINTGRHHQIDVIVARQQLLDFGTTRTLLNNIYQIVGFPKSAGKHHFAAFLERYMALDKGIIHNIMNTPSRWVLINRSQPQYVLSQAGISFL